MGLCIFSKELGIIIIISPSAIQPYLVALFKRFSFIMLMDLNLLPNSSGCGLFALLNVLMPVLLVYVHTISLAWARVRSNGAHATPPKLILPVTGAGEVAWPNTRFRDGANSGINTGSGYYIVDRNSFSFKYFSWIVVDHLPGMINVPLIFENSLESWEYFWKTSFEYW